MKRADLVQQKPISTGFVFKNGIIHSLQNHPEAHSKKVTLLFIGVIIDPIITVLGEKIQRLVKFQKPPNISVFGIVPKKMGD